MSKKLKILSLFSGAGGLDIGFENAGFETIWANDFDKKIAPSYKNYFSRVTFDDRSIGLIPNEEIPNKNISGVIGGPPCQSWSEAGARRGIKDPRGQLFYEYLRVIKHAQPSFFLAENVHGLIHSRNIDSFKNILKLFEKEGYVVSYKLLKASDFGVAQDRKRVFVVGYHKSLGKKFEFPEPLNVKRTLMDVIGDLKNLQTPSKKIKNHEYSTSSFSPIYMSRNRVRKWDEPSFTILATERHIPIHPKAPRMIKIDTDNWAFDKDKINSYRRLTVRECARVQDFPDNYHFIYDKIIHGYKMVGNAVPVNLAKVVAKKIMEDLKK